MTGKLAKRFFAKVRVLDDGCHLWTGAVDGCGYGRVSVGGKNRKAHRIAIMLAGRVLAADREVLHSCDRPACVNPAHLQVATHAENMADMATKGRASCKRGERNGRAKISADQARSIRDSEEPAAAVAAVHGLHWATVYRIRRGDLWEGAL